MARKKREVKERKQESKKSEVDKLMRDLSSTMGREVVRWADSTTSVFFVPYNLPALDYVSGGGVPVGRIIEHYGKESSTKSLAALHAVKSFQDVNWDLLTHSHQLDYSGESKNELLAAIVDVEGTYTKSWGEKIGIDNSKLIYADPDSMERAVDIADTLLRDERVSLVVFDSLSAIGDKTEVESSMEKDQMATTAKFWNKAVRKLQASMSSNPNRVATLIVINSAYDKVGFTMGNPEQVKNGVQLRLAKTISTKFNALKLEKGKDDELNSDENLGFNISLYNRKNKVGRPYLSATYYYSTVRGDMVEPNSIDYYAQLVDLAVKFGIIKRAGAWYSYDKIKVQGMPALIAELNGSYDSLAFEVYEHIKTVHHG